MIADERAGTPPLIEAVPISDDFADGIEIEDMTDIVRITYWTAHGPERVIVRRVVMTRGAYQRMVLAMTERRMMLS